jgi:hypothetical protein
MIIAPSPIAALLEWIAHHKDYIVAEEIFASASETKLTISIRTPKQLKADGITMQNLDGVYIKDEGEAMEKPSLKPQHFTGR